MENAAKSLVSRARWSTQVRHCTQCNIYSLELKTTSKWLWILADLDNDLADDERISTCRRVWVLADLDNAWTRLRRRVESNTGASVPMQARRRVSNMGRAYADASNPKEM